ncbi:hypothetical protein C0J52_01861 [Blattella germanica]|nr:hypothetical protein C0J52_01861 [Blattella germanica]
MLAVKSYILIIQDITTCYKNLLLDCLNQKIGYTVSSSRFKTVLHNWLINNPSIV